MNDPVNLTLYREVRLALEDPYFRRWISQQLAIYSENITPVEVLKVPNRVFSLLDVEVDFAGKFLDD